MSTFLSILWPENSVIRVMLLLMVALFAFSLVLAWRAYQQLRKERQAAQQLLTKTGLVPERGSVAVFLGPAAARLSGQLLTDMVNQKGLAFARPGDVLDPVLESVHRITAPPRSMPNLLLLSGLISTVVGLAFTLLSLGPQIQGAINSGDPATVARSLGLTLKEMGGAFAGTLWGVTAAFVLQALNAFSAVESERLSGDLDKVALRFAPDIYPASSEEQLTSLRDLIKRSEESLAAMQQSMSETSAQFATVLKEAGTVIQSSLGTLQETSLKVSEGLLKASGDVRQSSDQLTLAARAIRDHQQDFRNIYTSFNEMFERSMKALQLHSDQELQEIRNVQKDFGLTGQLIVQEIFKTSEKIVGLTGDIVQMNATFLTGTQEANTSIRAGFDRLDTELGKTLGAYMTEVHAVSNQMGQLQTATGALERTLRAGDEAEHTRQRDQHARMQALTGALAEVTAGFSQLQPIMTAVQQQTGESLTRLEGLQATTFAAMAEGNRDAQRRADLILQELTDKLERQTQGQETHTAQLREKAVEANGLLTGLLDQLSRQTEALAQQAADQAGVRGSLEQQRVASERMNQLLEALPGQLRLAELEQRQRELAEAVERLLGTLSFAMSQPIPEGPVA